MAVVMAGARVATIALVLLVTSACADRSGVEAGIFFPTWNAGGIVPAGIVQGVLVERDGCLLVAASGEEALVLWDDGYGFVNDSLLAPSGDVIVRVGELLHGGGGYFADREHAEDLSESSIPERCIPEGAEPFAVIYNVEAGQFE